MNNGEPYINDLLSAYHDGEVNAAEEQVAEKLLAESPDARSELEDYERISAELRTLPDDAPPIDVSGAVLAHIRKPVAAHATPDPAARNQRRSWRSLLPLGIAGAVAVAALAAVGLRMYFDFEPLGMPVARNAANERPPEEDSAVDAAATEMAPMSAPASDSGAMSAAPAPAIAMEAEEGSHYFADENARLPEGIREGGMYSYLQQTKEGDIVVVEAYVVDVRQAVDQIQVLLARNQIPTTTVSTAKENSLNLATAGPRNDLAVYVESDPQRVKVVLEDLRRQIGMPSNSIQGIEVAGVLDTPASGRDWSFTGPNAEPLDRTETDEDTPALAAPAPQGRGSIPDNAAPNADASGDMKMSTFGARPAPATEALSEPSTATPVQTEPPAEPALPMFQTVLNVSNTAISKELRRQQKSLKQRTLENETPPSEPELAESDAPAEAKLYSFEVPGAVRRFQGTERRLRLLVVLQQQPEPPAVQAPRP